MTASSLSVLLKKGLCYRRIGESDRTRGIGLGSGNRTRIGESDPNSCLLRLKVFSGFFVLAASFMRSEHFRDHKILLLLGWRGGGLSAYEQRSFDCFVKYAAEAEFLVREQHSF